MKRQIDLNKIHDVVIIGGGPVGIFSIFAFGMQGIDSVLIDALDKLGGQCAVSYPEKYIYDIPGFVSLKGRELVENLTNQAMPFAPDILLESMVENVEEFEDHFIITVKCKDSVKQVKSKTLVLALGAGIFSPIRLSAPEIEQHEGSQVLYYLDDTTKFENKKVAILGGGDSAVDWALDLADIANQVYLIHRRDYIKAHPASWEKANEHVNIDIKIPYMFSKLNVDNEKIIGLHVEANLENGAVSEHLEVDYILPCFGIKSDIGFINAWGLEMESGRIKVDPTTMRTSKKGIYAIGDCVYYNNKRKLIMTGFSEAAQCAIDLFKYVNPDRALQLGHSTSLGIPGKSKAK